MDKKFLIKKLIEFSIKYDTKYISQSFLNSDKNFPSSSTYKKYFKTWKNALDACNLYSKKSAGRPQNKEIYLTEKAKEIIIGELLGDGSIVFAGENKVNCNFSHSTANIYYGEYLYNKLSTEKVPLYEKEYIDNRNQFRTRTTVNKTWTKYRNEWYPNDIKIIPKSLKVLTKEMCLHWFLGDGYIEDNTIRFSTCGFMKEDVDYLLKLFNNIGFNGAVYKRSGEYYILKLHKEDSIKFLKWIDYCPVKCYEHKWNIKRNSNLL